MNQDKREFAPGDKVTITGTVVSVEDTGSDVKSVTLRPDLPSEPEGDEYGLICVTDVQIDAPAVPSAPAE